MINNLKFSYFVGGTSNIIPNKTVDINEVIRLITKDEQQSLLIETIREKQKNGLDDEATKLKLKRPYITTAGIFSQRNNESLDVSSYTWLIPIDIDKKDNPNVDWIKLYNSISNSEGIVLCAKSPRGEGIKALYLIEPNHYTPADQYNFCKNTFYPVIEKKFGCKLDYQQGVLSQPFLLTFDKNAYINTDPIPIVPPAHINIYSDKDNTFTSSELKKNNNNSKIIEKYLKIITETKSDLWSTFGKISYLIGGLFKGGVFGNINEEELLKSILKASRENKYNIDKNKGDKQVVTSFENGKKEPISKDDILLSKNLNKLYRKLKNLNSITQYIRVGNDYYKKSYITNLYKQSEPCLLSWKRQSIIDDHGIEYLDNIQTFDSFCNVPDNINYSPIYGNSYNLYQKFNHIPTPGEFPTIKALFTHIFKEQIEMGYDYIQLLLLNPTQVLPVLCLVSIDQQTGKTTFIDFIYNFFKGNVAIIGTADIEGNFNQHYISKLVIAIDESDLHKETNTAKIKQIATQKGAFRKAKFQDERHIDFFGKVIIASNNERSFIQVKDDDVRYWVRKIDTINTFDAEFEKKLISEIPQFLYFLKNRKLNTPEKKSRSWFDFNDLNNSFLTEAKEQNHSELWYELNESFTKWFITQKDDFVYVTLSEIREHFLENNMKFSLKYIKNVMYDEFKIKNIKMKRKGTFRNAIMPLDFFELKRSTFIK